MAARVCLFVAVAACGRSAPPAPQPAPVVPVAAPPAPLPADALVASPADAPAAVPAAAEPAGFPLHRVLGAKRADLASLNLLAADSDPRPGRLQFSAYAPYPVELVFDRDVVSSVHVLALGKRPTDADKAALEDWAHTQLANDDIELDTSLANGFEVTFYAPGMRARRDERKQLAHDLGEELRAAHAGDYAYGDDAELYLTTSGTNARAFADKVVKKVGKKTLYDAGYAVVICDDVQITLP